MSLFMWKEMYYDLKPCSNQIFHLLVFTYKVFFHIDDNHIKFNQTFYSVYSFCSCHCKFQILYIYILHTFSQTCQDPSPLEIFPDNLDIHIL